MLHLLHPIQEVHLSMGEMCVCPHRLDLLVQPALPKQTSVYAGTSAEPVCFCLCAIPSVIQFDPVFFPSLYVRAFIQPGRDFFFFSFCVAQHLASTPDRELLLSFSEQRLTHPTGL